MNKYMKNGLIIGAIFGFVQIPISFVFMNVDFFLRDILALEMGLYCKIFQAGLGEGCAFLYLITGFIVLPVIYGLFGGIIGFFWRIYKQWKK